MSRFYQNLNINANVVIDDTSYGRDHTWSADRIVEEINKMSIEDKQEILDRIETFESIRPIGNRGQVYYFKEDGLKDSNPDFILKKVNIVESDDDIEKVKDNKRHENFEEVFNTWKRFSHNKKDQQPAVPSELTSWKYDDENNRVICTVNSNSYIGFVSNERYKHYSFSCKIDSTNGDNDMIGFIIAFMTDSEGVEHTLTAVRIASVESHIAIKDKHQWGVVYDYGKSTAKVITSKSVTGDVVGNWNKFTNGCRIKVLREGDNIKAYTSALNGTEIDLNSELSFSLDSDPVLYKFKSDCSYGYSCLSQKDSTFTNISFSDGISNTIYDLRDSNNTLVYDDVNSQWVLSSDKSIMTDIGPGKFLYSDITKKLYYVEGTGNIITIISKADNEDSPSSLVWQDF